MRWLKHLTAAHRDDRLSAFLDAAGLEGYGFWWLLLEIVGHSVKGTQCELTYSLAQWSRLLCCHHHKVQKYFTLLATPTANTPVTPPVTTPSNHDSKGLVELEYVEGRIRVRIPNLLKYRDEYSKKSGHSPDENPERVGVQNTEVQKTEDRSTEVQSKQVQGSGFEIPSESRPMRKRTDDVFAEDSREYRAARYLFGKILKNNPEAKQPNFQSWARSFDRLFRIDERRPDEVRAVIDWCQADSFWLANILSPDTLRKKYDRLKLAMSSSSRASVQKPRRIVAAMEKAE